MSHHQINLGVIGMGYAGRQQVQVAAATPLRVVAIADATSLSAAGLDENVSLYDDWQQLLQHPELDVVSVCLPHHLHAEVAIAALKAGKHVLIEKPLASSVEEAREIIAAAREAECVLMVEMTHRFYPPLRAANEMIAKGRLGEIFAVEDRVIEWIIPEQMPAWLFQKSKAGGGVALTNGIHMLDRVRFVCDQSLKFRTGHLGYTHTLGDVEDTASMLLTLENGAPVSLLCSFARGTHPRIDDELTIYGTNGTLRVWAWRGWRWEPHAGEPEEEYSYPHKTDHYARVRVAMQGAMQEFAASIIQRRAPSVPVEQVLAAQEIVEELYQQQAKP